MNIELKIATANEFEQIYSLMESAFPPPERRVKEKQKELFKNEVYEVASFYYDGIFVGFMAYWKLGKFVFAEHFAVEPKMRNGGIGSECLKMFLEYTNLPVVLEVEDAEENLPQRRIKFYERNGFVLSNVSYIQPKLQTPSEDVMLKLMYHTNKKEIDISYAKSEIFKKVYNI